MSETNAPNQSPAATIADAGTLAAELDRARERTDLILSAVTDEGLTEQVSPLQSPLVWDYAHVAYFEELWLLRRIGGASPLHELHDDVYDAFRHARSERGELPILAPAAARAYALDVRERVHDLLERIELDPADPLLRDGFVVGMVVQHELQHGETMRQTLALRSRPYLLAPDPSPVPALGPPELQLHVGTYAIGAVDVPWAYDNERRAHEVELETFRIDRVPVTNAELDAFVAAGGYHVRSLWSDEGWAWCRSTGATAPLGWREDGARTRFGVVEALDPHAPVEHVSFFEAEAYARFVGGRLPTEAEWEAAAPLLEGRGIVWEWTSSTFGPYPGFRAFPYAEYSEVFFGDAYRVLRGGSWATDPLVARPSFRNWDHPQRRQIFSGIRVAHDA